MLRYIAAIGALLFVAAAIQAEEFRGTVKSVDLERNQITIHVGNGERTLHLAKDAKVLVNVAVRLRRTATTELINGLPTLAPNTPVWVTTEPRDGIERVTTIQIEGVQRRGLILRP